MTPPRPSRRLAAAFAVALALLVAGCGDDAGSGPDQETAFGIAYPAKSAKIEAIGKSIAEALGNADQQSDAEVQRAFAALATRADRIVAELGALDPPEDLAGPLQRLQRAVATAATDLEAITKAAGSEDPEAARAAAQALVTDSAPIRDARAELDRLLAR